MYNFLGRKLNISDEKLKEYEHFMYGPLTDDVIYHYIYLEYGFDADESPEKFAELTDEQVTAAILKHMESEMEPMRPRTE